MDYKKEFKKIYSDDLKRDQTVGYGKYASRSFDWVSKHDPKYFKSIKKESFYKKFNLIKQKKYEELLKKTFKDEELYQDKREEIVNFCILNVKKGISYNQINKELKKLYDKISESFINATYIEAKDTIKKDFEIERDFLIDIHVLRYEELFFKATNPDITKVPLAYRNSVLAESYFSALDILLQKEKILGVHTKTFKTYINNFIQEKKKKSVELINLDVLTLTEKCNLLKLIELTKNNIVIQNQTISSSTKTDVITVESNIQKQIEAPIRESKQTDITLDEAIDLNQKSKNLVSIQTSIQENLRKQVEEAFRKNKK